MGNGKYKKAINYALLAKQVDDIHIILVGKDEESGLRKVIVDHEKTINEVRGGMTLIKWVGSLITVTLAVLTFWTKHKGG